MLAEDAEGMASYPFYRLWS